MKDVSLSDILSNTTTGSEAILMEPSESEGEPFAEYLWMEHEEEFDREVEEQLWEEEFIEQCFQELLGGEEEEDEEGQWVWFSSSGELQSPTLTHLQEQISLLVLDKDLDANLDVAVNSSLNPNAKVFIPGIQRHVM
ncbi:polyadenylate-binding protein-interacting protein 2-like [Antennarius striatus]|uniref:polyadenylate-binding protein-interacting protein 2-like n=1 Tax=Antennarius striatus TaxID=241820 RepID=UPI0035B2D637